MGSSSGHRAQGGTELQPLLPWWCYRYGRPALQRDHRVRRRHSRHSEPAGQGCLHLLGVGCQPGTRHEEEDGDQGSVDVLLLMVTSYYLKRHKWSMIKSRKIVFTPR